MRTFLPSRSTSTATLASTTPHPRRGWRGTPCRRDSHQPCRAARRSHRRSPCSRGTTRAPRQARRRRCRRGIRVLGQRVRQREARQVRPLNVSRSSAVEHSPSAPGTTPFGQRLIGEGHVPATIRAPAHPQAFGQVAAHRRGELDARVPQPERCATARAAAGSRSRSGWRRSSACPSSPMPRSEASGACPAGKEAMSIDESRS